MILDLRRAGQPDSEMLLVWRNDPATVANSLSRKAVDPDEHKAWLERVLDDADTTLLIVEIDAGLPIGTVRLDRQGDTVELSLTIDPGRRGLGLGGPVIEFGVECARQVYGARTVVAKVRPDNQASLRSFARAGFANEGADPSGAFELLTFSPSPPRTAVIIQARSGSSRLPKKVLEDLGGQSVLETVLKRCARIPGTDVVVCATVATESCDPIVEIAQGLDVPVFRGSERDVLDRYMRAARMVNASNVLRVTSDCPLIDPDLCGGVLAARREKGADYATNNMPPSWPHGLDTEAFTRMALDRADRLGRTPDAREHVSPYIRNAPEFRRANVPAGRDDLRRYRWTLDFPEDLLFLRAVSGALSMPMEEATTDDVLALLAEQPRLAQINESHLID